MRAGVILYGPPASGKDTITQELLRLSRRYQPFQRLKVGPGRKSGYRITTKNHLEELCRAGAVVWENHRYGATYIIDAPALDEALRHSLPVVHVGQPAAVDRIASIPDARWLVVELWCPRDIAAARLVARGTVDTTQRLEVWDKTPRLINPDLVIDTSTAEPGVAARQIDNRLRDGTAPAPALDWSALGPAVGPRRHLPYLLESEVTVKRGLNRFLAVVTLRFLCAILGCEGRRFVPPETRFLPVRALGSCATSRNAAGVRVYLRGRRVVLPMRPRQVSSLSTCRGRTTDPRAVVVPSGQEEE